jgi:hypothetical protein
MIKKVTNFISLGSNLAIVKSKSESLFLDVQKKR